MAKIEHISLEEMFECLHCGCLRCGKDILHQFGLVIS